MSGLIGHTETVQKTGVIGLPPKGDWVLLQEKTINGNVTEVDLGNGTSEMLWNTPFNGTFRDYKIIGSEVCVASGTDSHIGFRWSCGGLLTSGYKWIASGRDSGNTHRQNSNSSGTYAQMTGDGNLQQGTGYGGMHFEMTLNNARSSHRHVVTGWAAYRCGNNGGVLMKTEFIANREGTAAAIDYVRFWGINQSITAGRFSLYGMVGV